jgi:resuscitation-promoting factor RpfB
MTSTVGIDATLNALTKLYQNNSIALRAVVGALLLTLTGAGCYAVAAQKTVTLDVDGSPMTVSTMKSRVIDVVHENGFTVGDRDDLFPSADQQVDPAQTIVLRRSRPVDVSMDGQQSRQMWTTASTVEPAAAGRHGAAGSQPQERAYRRQRGSERPPACGA